MATTAVRPGLWEGASLARALCPPALPTRVVQEPNLSHPQPTSGTQGGHILIGRPTPTQRGAQGREHVSHTVLQAAVNPTELLPRSLCHSPAQGQSAQSPFLSTCAAADIVSLPDRVQASDLDLEA